MTEKFSENSKIRVLLVEDNDVDRRLMTDLLTQEESKFILFPVKTLEKAKSTLREHQIDVAILDLNLSDSKGEQTVSGIVEASPQTAVVITTGAYMDDTGIRTLELGAQDFLIKGKYTGYSVKRALEYAIERKRLELRLQQTTNELKKLQDQLIESEKLKVVGGLASGVAHEVKNPLSTIVYGITYLENELKDKGDNISFVLENIHDAANRASRIITDLLDFSSMHTIELTAADIHDVLEQALKLTHHEYSERRISIIKEYGSGLSQVRIDPLRIEQVLVNLLLNAFYAVNRGGEITVTTREISGSEAVDDWHFDLHETDEDKNFVIVCCDDSGPGIPPEKIRELFDPFFTTRRGEGGIGLGLSVSKTIIDMHHAYINLENRDGGGARAALLFRSI